jgi:hypothetical protein
MIGRNGTMIYGGLILRTPLLAALRQELRAALTGGDEPL